MALGKLSKIHPIALGLTLGLLAGAAAFGMGLLALLFLNGKPLVSMLGTMYITYQPSLANSAIGGILVFLNMAIGGYITAWMYNFLIEYI